MRGKIAAEEITKLGDVRSLVSQVSHLVWFRCFPPTRTCSTPPNQQIKFLIAVYATSTTTISIFSVTELVCLPSEPIKTEWIVALSSNCIDLRRQTAFACLFAYWRSTLLVSSTNHASASSLMMAKRSTLSRATQLDFHVEVLSAPSNRNASHDIRKEKKARKVICAPPFEWDESLVQTEEQKIRHKLKRRVGDFYNPPLPLDSDFVEIKHETSEKTSSIVNSLPLCFSVSQLYEALHVGEHQIRKERELYEKLEILNSKLGPLEKVIKSDWDFQLKINFDLHSFSGASALRERREFN